MVDTEEAVSRLAIPQHTLKFSAVRPFPSFISVEALVDELYAALARFASTTTLSLALQYILNVSLNTAQVGVGHSITRRPRHKGCGLSEIARQERATSDPHGLAISG